MKMSVAEQQAFPEGYPDDFQADLVAEEKKKKGRAAMRAVMALAEAVRDSKSIPNGELYALVMDFMDLNTYNSFVALLVSTGLVQIKNQLLIWVGPKTS